MNSSQQKALTDALERIVICEAIAMDLRQRALQGIEDLEMGSAADKMTIRDVHSFMHNSPLRAARHDYWDQQDA